MRLEIDSDIINDLCFQGTINKKTRGRDDHAVFGWLWEQQWFGPMCQCQSLARVSFLTDPICLKDCHSYSKGHP